MSSYLEGCVFHRKTGEKCEECGEFMIRTYDSTKGYVERLLRCFKCGYKDRYVR